MFKKMHLALGLLVKFSYLEAGVYLKAGTVCTAAVMKAASIWTTTMWMAATISIPVAAAIRLRQRRQGTGRRMDGSLVALD